MEMIFILLVHNNYTHTRYIRVKPTHWVPLQYTWNLILTLHHHNNCTTTPHMRVDPGVWGPSSCEGLLCSCCIGVVNLTFSNIHCVSVVVVRMTCKYHFHTLHHRLFIILLPNFKFWQSTS
jgi:hypothetical protein